MGIFCGSWRKGASSSWSFLHCGGPPRRHPTLFWACHRACRRKAKEDSGISCGMYIEDSPLSFHLLMRLVTVTVDPKEETSQAVRHPRWFHDHFLHPCSLHPVFQGSAGLLLKYLLRRSPGRPLSLRQRTDPPRDRRHNGAGLQHPKQR